MSFTRVAVTASVVAAMQAGLAPAPYTHAEPPSASAPAAVSSSYGYVNSVNVGDIPSTAVVDPTRNRVYVPVDRLQGNPGGITWFDPSTGQASPEVFELEYPEPKKILLSADASEIYAIHYRTKDKEGGISVLDAETGEIKRFIGGIPRFIDTAVVHNGVIYLTDGKAIIKVDPSTGSVSAPLQVSTQKYPLIKDIVVDPKTNKLWVAEGRGLVLTTVSLETFTWDANVEIKVSDWRDTGGRASKLALDPVLGHLYVAVDSRLNDAWTTNKIQILDSATGKHYDHLIEVGESIRDLVVNPVTHELIVSDGGTNSVYIVSPDTWSATKAADFNALGITTAGAGGVNTYDAAFTPDGEQLYVTNPYAGEGSQGGKLSILKRAGGKPAITPLKLEDVSPEGSDPTPPQSPDWVAPKHPALPEAPKDSKEVSGATFSWGINNYAGAWTKTALGAAEQKDSIFTFQSDEGWFDQSNGSFAINYRGGVRISHYEGLNIQVITELASPTVHRNPDGSGYVTASLSWQVDDQLSPGYKRVTLMTFANSEIERSDAGTRLVIQPDFENATYQGHNGAFPTEFIDALPESMRAWWYRTGASQDDNKAPLPIHLQIPDVFVDAPSPDPDLNPPSDSPSSVTTPWIIALTVVAVLASVFAAAIGVMRNAPQAIPEPLRAWLSNLNLPRL